MNIVFFGPPGSGKGTYASRAGPQIGIPHISTGDLLRAEVAAGSKLGKEAEGYMKEGDLVPDKLVINMVEQRLKENDAKKGFILDGFPRTIEQMKDIEKFTEINLVINLHMPDEMLVEKALARVICEKCGQIYNLADINRNGVHLPPLLPKKEGICDKCGGKLIHRKDDNEATIRDRIEVYRKQSEPLLKYYYKKKLVKDVKVVGSPDIMVPIILKEIKSALKI
jgi:adenylate kinase